MTLGRLVRGLASPGRATELARAIAGLCQFVILAASLGADGYGVLSLLLVAVSFATAALTAPLTLGTVQRAAAGVTKSKLLLRSTSWLLVWSVLLALVTVALSRYLGPSVDLPTILLLLAGEFALATLLLIFASIAQGAQDLGRYRSIVLLATAGRLVACGLFFLLDGTSVRDWSALLVIALSVAAVSCLVPLRRVTTVTPGDRVRSTGVADAGVFVASSITSRLTDDLDKVVLGAFASAEAVGIYTAGYRMAGYVFFAVRAALAVTLPGMLAAGLVGDGRALRKLRSQAVRTVAISVACVAPVVALGAILLPVLLGQEYVASQLIALALLPALSLRGLHYANADVLTAAGRLSTRLGAQVIGFLAPGVLLIWLVPTLGVWGAILATAIGEGLAALLMWRLASNVLREMRSDHSRLGKAAV